MERGFFFSIEKTWVWKFTVFTRSYFYGRCEFNKRETTPRRILYFKEVDGHIGLSE